jgi:hypothetical protein
MHEMRWLHSHVGTVEDGIALINRLLWNMTIDQVDGFWVVRGGEKVIFQTDNRESLESFVYGFALAYSILDDDTIERFLKTIGDIP